MKLSLKLKRGIAGLLITANLLSACASGQRLTGQERTMLGKERVEDILALTTEEKIRAKDLLNKIKKHFQELNDIIEMLKNLANTTKDKDIRLKLVGLFYKTLAEATEDIYKLPISMMQEERIKLEELREDFRDAARSELSFVSKS